MPAAEYEAFRADMLRRGQQVPVEITAENVVLDGHERLRAALELGVERLEVRVVSPPDELEYILLAAITSRQLSASQRATLAVELEQYRHLQGEARRRQRANLRGSAEVATLPPRGKTREQAATWAGVSARTIQDAATVQANDPQLFERVKSGKLTASNAAGKVRRAQRDRALPPPPPLPGEPVELIYADPPWQLGNPDGPHAPEQHYPCMPLAEIKALAVPAAEDALLFLWAVSSLMPEALEVIEAWGFEYKSQIVWDKGSIGPGVWVRNQHELLLVARKGTFSPPEPEDRCPSVITAPRGRHSEKPDCFYELIERAYPRASKLELFARRARPGWSGWGNELQP